MFLIETYLIGCFIIGGLVYFQGHRQRKVKQQHAQSMLLLVSYLRVLLELLPKHRGMANALLKGDGSFRAALADLKTKIEKQLASLNDYKKHGHLPHDIKSLQQIPLAWNDIQRSLTSMSAADSFSRHTQLIATVMECLDDAGLYLQQTFSAATKNQSLLQVVTHELPHALESMGQARGIGTGIAAQGKSTAANRINLKFLHGKAIDIVNKKLLPVKSMLHGNIAQQKQSLKLEAAVKSAQHFLDSLNRDLIQTEIPAIAPDTFYQHGTRAIEAGFVLLDMLLAQWIDSVGLASRH